MLYLGVVINEGRKLTRVSELSNEIYSEYALHLAKVNRFENDLSLYMTVELNYQEIHSTIQKYSEQFQKNSQMSWVLIRRIILDINRRVLNYLSTFRTYLDHAEYLLKKEYGKDSEQVKKFKEVCSKEYDNNFAYRFLYKLRNYSQHCGMPVGNVSLGQRANKDNGIDYSLIVTFDRDELLRSYDSWGNPVKGELEKLPPGIVVNEYLEELQECIKRIQSCLMEFRVDELRESVDYIRNLINPLEKYEGTPCIMDFSKMKQDDGDIGLRWFPIHIIQMFDDILDGKCK
ncbi:Uncharacterized protein BC141101_01204 [Bacillus toyonensis]|uniref:hypothetical protein n=1 Tax=Bacillus cereus group TaxID=86661 RepID=UPI0008645255|nr:hypothetical protein [Bacillus toyonensis]SCN16034.1 Uncharacterized protein BC141101_01204 [Bacillus toyonensis]